MRPCSVAGCTERGRVRCSICKVWYCGPQCQEKDWPAHLGFCERPPPLEWPLKTISCTTPTVEGEDKEKQVEEDRSTVEIPKVEYKEAIISSEMAIKHPTKKKRYGIVPIEYFESLSEFSVRLEMEVTELNTEHFFIQRFNFRMTTAKTC